MGLFSNRYKTVVGTTVSRVIPDESLPNSAKTGVFRAILQNNGMPENIMEELFGSIGVRAERMYNYAKDNYTHGLPSGTLYKSAVGVPEVQAILNAMHGGEVELTYVHLGPPNAMHFGWTQAIAQHGYNPNTNILPHVPKPEADPTIVTHVYMEDMVVVVPQERVSQMPPDALEIWGPAANSGFAPSRAWMTPTAGRYRTPTPVVIDPNATQEYVRIHWIYQTNMNSWEWNDQYRRGTINIPFTGPMAIPTRDYFQARYIYNGQIRYWTYLAGSGTHVTLDRLVTKPPGAAGSFFPLLYFRHNKTNQANNKSSQAYLTSKKMAKTLGMDFDMVCDSIDENPDIGDVEQAFLMFAVPANTEDPLELEYLYEFFEKIYFSRGQLQGSPVVGSTRFMLNGDEALPRFAIGIEDNRFKMSLSDAGMYKTRRVGQLGPIGSCHMGIGQETYTAPYIDPFHGGTTFRTYTIKHHYYRKQTSRFMYDEIQVVDLQMMYQVLEGYRTTADEDDDILLIPLDRSITEKYQILDREQLYSRSLHFVFNSSQVIKIKWYQTSWFQAVVVIVAVVLVVVSYGSAFEALGVALATGSTVAITAAVLTLLTNIFTGILYSFAFKLFVQAVGIDVAIVLAFLFAIYGYYQWFSAGSLAGAPFAQELLTASSGLIKASNDVVKDDMSNLLAEYESWNLFKDEAVKELEEANKLLSSRNYLEPAIIFGESPNDFYNRTVHSGNTGVLGISAISKYVDIALTLPDMSATIGES